MLLNLVDAAGPSRRGCEVHIPKHFFDCCFVTAECSFYCILTTYRLKCTRIFFPTLSELNSRMQTH